MDIVEYVEKVCEVKLLEYQKIYLRAMYDEYKKHGKIVFSTRLPRYYFE